MRDPAAVVGAFNTADRAWWGRHGGDPDALAMLLADPELMSVHREMAVCRLRCSAVEHPMHGQVGRSVAGSRAAVSRHLAGIRGSGLSEPGRERAARRLLAALQGVLVIGAVLPVPPEPARFAPHLLAIVGERAPVGAVAGEAGLREAAFDGFAEPPSDIAPAADQQSVADEDAFERAVLEANVRFAFGTFDGRVEDSLAQVHDYFDQVDALRAQAGDPLTISLQTLARAAERPAGDRLREFTRAQVAAAHADLVALLDVLAAHGWLRDPTSVSTEAFVLLAMVVGLCVDAMYVEESRGVADELDAHLRLLAHWP